jgi:hypothetical protein
MENSFGWRNANGRFADKFRHFDKPGSRESSNGSVAIDPKPTFAMR